MELSPDTPDPLVAKAIEMTLMVLKMERLARDAAGAERDALLIRAKIGRVAAKRALASVQGGAA